MGDSNGATTTSYSIDSPSYAWTTATTQFDDELIRRGIVTREQALLAKGMSESTLQELLAAETAAAAAKSVEEACPGIQEDEDDDDDDSEEFLRAYRQKRILEFKRKMLRREPRIIDRTEWKRHVNEASEKEWVLVCLTSSDVERTGAIEAAVHELSVGETNCNVVLIPAHSAIPNWPHENLPSLFLYRHGKMQHQLVRLPVDISAGRLYDILEELGVFDNEEIQEDLDALD